jgi:hypothetical protein
MDHLPLITTTSSLSSRGLVVRDLVVLLTGNDRAFPATNLQFVAVRILKEKRVVAGTVIDANFGAFQILSASFANQVGDAIDFFAGTGPECDSCSIWAMIFIFGETEEFRWLVAAGGIKGMEIVAGTFVNEPELRQELPVKSSREFHVFHSQINMIKASCFHFLTFM